MAKNATKTDENFEILEGYFNKYPDVPKETIVKQHMLSLGHWFSDAALDACKGALVKSYRLFSYDLVPMTELKRGEHRRARHNVSRSVHGDGMSGWRQSLESIFTIGVGDCLRDQSRRRRQQGGKDDDPRRRLLTNRHPPGD